MGIRRKPSKASVYSIVVALWAALFMSCACDGSDGARGSSEARDAGAARDDGGVANGGDSGAAVATSIGPEGATLRGPKGSSVEVPAGALSGDVDIGIAESAEGAPPLPPGFTAFGPIFALTPHGTQFAEPVTVTLPFDPANVPDGGKPGLYKTDADRQWVPVDGATFEGDHVTAKVTGFSWFVPGATGIVRELPIRNYEFRFFHTDGTMEPEVIHPVVIGGELDEIFPMGENPVFDIDHDGKTSLEVYSNAEGTVFCAMADGPQGNPSNPKSMVAAEAQLTQAQSFIKTADNATLRFQVDQATLEAVDFNGDPSPSECPPGINSLDAVLNGVCDLLKARVAFTARAYDDHGVLFDTHHRQVQAGGYADLSGISGKWYLKTGIYVSAPGLTYGIWDKDDFDFVQDKDGSSGKQHPSATLAHLVDIDVDLTSVKRGQEFTVESLVLASAYNHRARESGLGAYLCDPERVGATKMIATGLLPTNRPLPPPSDAPVALPECKTPDPAAGVIELSSATYAAAEEPFAGRAVVEVTRSKGSTGPVSVTVTLGGGDAVSGKDYVPLTTTVFFGDGDTTPRTVPIEIVLDGDPEPDRTVNVTLSDPGGCAKLGAVSSAVLTILDDDRTVMTDTFTVGGTVSGLSGKGLVLTSLGTSLPIDADGKFVFSEPKTTGSLYDVRIETQPREPDQSCVVANGRGNIDGSDVTNITVTCTTIAIDPLLDPGFGVAGVVSTNLGGGAAMVREPDGKILMIGGGANDFGLARFQPDGSLDDGFGSGGVVTTDLGSATEDAANAVALQTDGKILVAGYSVTGHDAKNFPNYDFALVRYNPDGSLDGSFGTGGKVTTDFAGTTDRANAVLVQADGKIVVAGEAAFIAANGVGGGLDFGVVRYDASGRLDPSFGTGGKVTTDFGGGGDFAYSAALAKDGAILVSGAIGFPGDSSADHTGVARYGADGKLDLGFGTAGKLVVRDVELGDGLAVQSDGKLLLAGVAHVAGVAQFGLMRVTAAGATDPSFGTSGLVTTGFSTQNDVAKAVAVQPDGKILVAGQSSNLANADFALARYSTDGKLDSSFGTGGKLTHDFFGGFDGAESIAVQPDGKIVVGGFARNGQTGGYALLRTR